MIIVYYADWWFFVCLLQLHPWRLIWNIVMDVWKIMFLSQWVICRFHVHLPGCKQKKNVHVICQFLRCLVLFSRWRKSTNQSRSIWADSVVMICPAGRIRFKKKKTYRGKKPTRPINQTNQMKSIQQTNVGSQKNTNLKTTFYDWHMFVLYQSFSRNREF